VQERLKSLSTRLARQARETFVGRDDELAVLQTLLAEDGPLVVHLHGIQGVGKTTLLNTFSDRAQAYGARPLIMDCRLVEPTGRGFLAELARLTGSAVESLADAAEVLGADDRLVVLSLDHYESFLLLDTWLRQTLLPALPVNVRLVMASRQSPVPMWMLSTRWHGLFRDMAVEPLGHEASMALLSSAGIEDAEAARLASLAHGNPLALKMAASATLAQGSLTFQDTAIQEVMQQLTSLYLAEVEEPAIRDALKRTCVARRITRSLLRALPGGDDQLFDSLQQLPFVDTCRDGLRIHDSVREAMAQTLHSADPELFHESRRLLWRQLREEFRSSTMVDIWRYTADMLFLIENPAVRGAFFPSGQQELAVEPAQPTDFTVIREIAGLHESPEAVAVFDQWWEAMPHAFRVVRNRDGRLVAFYCMSVADEIADEVRRADPVVDTWLDHLIDHPMPQGGKALFIRRWLAHGPGESPSPEQAACWLDLKRTYMELRPALRRAYLTVVDLPIYAPAAQTLGFQVFDDWSVELDERTYHCAMLDFGSASVDGWLTRLVGDELGVHLTSPVDRQRRALVLDGREITLTPLEYKLAVTLEDLGGETATRDQLLDDVWGHQDGSGSSNVVDAVVKSLRRKLGAESCRVETVRGFGYRWRCD